MTKSVNLYLASGVFKGVGFWVVNFTEEENIFNSLGSKLLECYRKELFGLDGAIEVKGAINTTLDILCFDSKYDQYKLNEVIKIIYEFVYNYFCDWYIEFTKTRFYGKDLQDKKIAESVSIYVLKNIVKLLHPFTPHITEEIWSFLKQDQENCMETIASLRNDNDMSSKCRRHVDDISSKCRRRFDEHSSKCRRRFDDIS